MAGLKLLCITILMCGLSLQVRANHSLEKLKNLQYGERDSIFASKSEMRSNYTHNTFPIKNEKRGIIQQIAKLLRPVLPQIPTIAHKLKVGLLVMVDLGDTGLKIASIVKSLGDSYTKGCFSVPMICTYMGRIKEIEPRCIAKAATLEKIYGKQRENYGLLQKVTANNIYINAKIKVFVDMLDVLDQEGRNVKKIQDGSLDLKNLQRRADDDILKLLYIPIKYSVVKLEELKQSATIFEADLFSILAFEIGSYVAKSAFSKYTKHMGAIKCAGCSLVQNPATRKQYTVMVYQALKLTYADFKGFFKDEFFIKNIKVSSQNMWKQFKQKITNPKSTVQKYIKGLTAAAAFGKLAANAINIYLLIQQHKAWKDIETKMKDAWEKYKEREKDLDNAIKDAKEKSEPIPSYTQNAINNYVEFIETFDKKVNLLLQHSGLPKHIFTSKGKVTITNIQAKQTETLKNMDKIIGSLAKMKNWMKAFSTFNDHVKNKLDANVPLNAAYKEIKDNWQYFSKDAHEYFFLVRLENYVCTVSTLRLTDDFYTNYELKSIRGTCALSSRYVFSEEYKRNHKQHTIDFYTKHHLTSAKSLGELRDQVGQELKDDPIINSDSGLTDQLLLCKVAEFTSHARWSFFKLQPFRVTNCKTMPRVKFRKLLYQSME